MDTKEELVGISNVNSLRWLATEDTEDTKERLAGMTTRDERHNQNAVDSPLMASQRSEHREESPRLDDPTLVSLVSFVMGQRSDRWIFGRSGDRPEAGR